MCARKKLDSRIYFFFSFAAFSASHSLRISALSCEGCVEWFASSVAVGTVDCTDSATAVFSPLPVFSPVLRSVSPSSSEDFHLVPVVNGGDGWVFNSMGKEYKWAPKTRLNAYPLGIGVDSQTFRLSRIHRYVVVPKRHIQM